MLSGSKQSKYCNACSRGKQTSIASRCTVKLTGAKLPANAGKFTSGLHVKRPHTQFSWVTCSLPVKTGKFTHLYAASTSRRIHANCLQQLVNLPEYNGYFIGNFTSGTHASLPAAGMQNRQLLREKLHAICRQKHQQSQAKIREICRQTPVITGKNNCKSILQVKLHSTCVLFYLRLRVVGLRRWPHKWRRKFSFYR